MPALELQHRLQSTEPPIPQLGRIPRSELVNNVEQIGNGRPGEVLIIIPSTAPDRETNQKEFGRFIAGWIGDRNRETLEQGRIPLLDLPTGGTPRPVWPELGRLVADGEIDLSRTI